jgi:hypothetical protein
MRRHAVGLLTSALVAASAAACGGIPPSAPPAPSAPAPTQPSSAPAKPPPPSPSPSPSPKSDKGVKTEKQRLPRTPEQPATNLFGTRYAYVTSSRGNRVTFDLVEFYGGKAATKACAEDGVTSREGVWCAEYYIRNKNPRLRWLGADPAGRYRLIGDGDWVTVSMDKFLRRVRGTDRLVKLSIDGGRLLGAEEMWQS